MVYRSRQRPDGAHPVYWVDSRAVPPADWSKSTIKEISSNFKGKLPSAILEKPTNCSKPYLLLDGLRNGKHVFTEDTHLPSVIESDTVVIADGSKSGFAVRGFSGVLGSTLLAFRKKGENSESFLYHLLSSLFPLLESTTTGTAIPHLDQDLLLELRLAIPPREEQEAIARILDAVDAAIERTREAVEKANDLCNALIQEFLFNALGDTAYANHPTKELPQGWKLVPTGELLESEPKNGASPQANTQPPGIPTFSIAAIRNGMINLDLADHLKYAQISEKAAGPYKIVSGDVLIVRGNANPDLVGKAAIVRSFPDSCIYPDLTKRVIFKKVGDVRVSPEYAVLIWNHAVVHNQVLRRAKTSNGTLKINSRDVKQIIMPVAPIFEQEKIIALQRVALNKVLALSQLISAFQELKKSLMHDLLTGKVRVNYNNMNSHLGKTP